MAGTKRDKIPPGTLEMLILQTLRREGLRHGFEIAESIQQRSEGVLQVEEGSLYPALQRLLINSLVTGKWGKTEDNRRARYYKLTAAGRRQLDRELLRYQRVSEAIASITQPV